MSNWTASADKNRNMILNCDRAIFSYATFKDKTDSERDVTITTKITIDRLFDKHFQCSDCQVLFFVCQLMDPSFS